MAANLQDGTNQEVSAKIFRRQRLKVSNACQPCRLRKAKCDGVHPVCARCQARGKACTYNRDPLTAGQQPKPKPPVRIAPIRSRGPVPTSPPALRPYPPKTSSASEEETPSTSRPSSRPGDLDGDLGRDQDQNRAYYTAHGSFAGDVAAAIDVRAGIAPAATSHLVPFVDAPLFGEVVLDSPSRTPGSGVELPPRAYADRLVDIYWRYVDPVEPVLLRKCFVHDYEASYSRSGASLHADPDVWLSILNALFALAVQRQESTPRQKRDEESNRYFGRAWALLRPETIIWKPGSIDLVQCLMLMNRYLHCTNNQHKTWMTAGLAMRIAQNTGCYLPEASSAKDACKDRELKQRVWASCVGLDRCVSWSLGRTSEPNLIPSPSRADSMFRGGGYQQRSGHTEHITWTLELHEIGNQIQLAQAQTRNGLSAKLGLPRLYQQDEYHAVAIQLDACLNKWESDLPSEWKLQNLPKVVNRTSRAKGYLLHLRFLHSRIYLYRPMLARLYSMKSHPARAHSTSSPPSLSDRLLRECAEMCIETAQKVASLIIETLEPDEPMGLLPWWYRIYYLHIAGTNFLATMFRPDLFTESVSQSWDSVMSALRAHEHLSTYVSQCIRTFDCLSARVLATRCPNPEAGVDVPLQEGTPGFFCDDIFHDESFDFDQFLFGVENIVDGQ